MISNSRNKSLIYKNQSKTRLQKQKTKESEEKHRILSIYKSNYSKIDLNEGIDKKRKPKSKIVLDLHENKNKKIRKELLKSVNLKLNIGNQ